jgi:hypothetical protein
MLCVLPDSLPGRDDFEDGKMICRQWTEDLSKMDKKLSQMDNSHVT